MKPRQFLIPLGVFVLSFAAFFAFQLSRQPDPAPGDAGPAEEEAGPSAPAAEARGPQLPAPAATETRGPKRLALPAGGGVWPWPVGGDAAHGRAQSD